MNEEICNKIVELHQLTGLRYSVGDLGGYTFAVDKEPIAVFGNEETLISFLDILIKYETYKKNKK